MSLVSAVSATDLTCVHQVIQCVMSLMCFMCLIPIQVVSCVFQYLRMVREQGPERRLWEELNAVERNEFNFMEPVRFCLSVYAGASI